MAQGPDTEDLKARLKAKWEAKTHRAELGSVFDSVDDSEREAAVRRFAEAGTEEAFEVLRDRGLSDSALSVRLLTIEALTAWGPDRKLRWGPREPRFQQADTEFAVDTLLAVVRDERINEVIRKSALDLLAESDKSQAAIAFNSYVNELDWATLRSNAHLFDTLLKILIDRKELRLLKRLANLLRDADWTPRSYEGGQPSYLGLEASYVFDRVVSALIRAGDADLQLLSGLDGFPARAHDIVAQHREMWAGVRKRELAESDLRRAVDAILARGLDDVGKEKAVLEALSEYAVATGYGSDWYARVRIGFCNCGFPTKEIQYDESWGPIFPLTRMEQIGRDWQDYFCPKCGTFVKRIASSA